MFGRSLSAGQRRSRFLLPCALLSTVVFGGCREKVDLMVLNGNVYTVDEAAPKAQAFTVRDNRFVAVGDNENIREGFEAETIVDAAGSTIVPGLIDAHGHLLKLGLSLLRANLIGTKSKADVVHRLKEFERELPDGAWITGRGWDQNDWPEQVFPTRVDLDKAFPNRPVWIERIDGHASWLNSAALRVLGPSVVPAFDPPGGKIIRDPSGEPTGIFIDSAADAIEVAAPAPSAEVLEAALRRALEETARFGLTGIHEPGVKLDTLRLYERALDEGWLTIRLYAMTEGRTAIFDRLCKEGPILSRGGRLTVRASKVYGDGALGSRGAALLSDYSDDPGNVGLLRKSEDEFAADIRAAATCGLQPAVHAIGDRANRIILDLYERLLDPAEITRLRPRIEHAQIVSPDDLDRFSSLGIVASMQPAHATSDMYWAVERLGDSRLHGAYAWKTIVDSGAHVPLGSDTPVESANPLTGFYAAVTRQDESAFPEGGWISSERLSREAALRGYTIEAAYAAFWEDEVGSIAVGKQADFVILDRDIMTVRPEEILSTRVVATYLDGIKIFGSAAED